MRALQKKYGYLWSEDAINVEEIKHQYIEEFKLHDDAFNIDGDAYRQSVHIKPKEKFEQLVLHPDYRVDALDALHKKDKQQLDEVISRLKDKANLRISVLGHTNNIKLSLSNRQKFGDNRKLSLLRAKSVAGYLQNKLGLDDSSIYYDGAGDIQPMASNDTVEGRKLNRRVEINMDYLENGERQDILSLPSSYTPWWRSKVTTQLIENSENTDITLETLFLQALDFSSQIDVFRDIPLIRETAILEATGRFDIHLFSEAWYKDTNEPVGSTLRTGGPDRFKEQESRFKAGLRGDVLTGGNLRYHKGLAGLIVTRYSLCPIIRRYRVLN